jgi:lipopolysaccharide export system protein LptA
MSLPVTRLRRWFAAAAILMIAIVAGMYFYARWRVRGAIHEVPAKIGLNIQQTAEGFSISKSEQGRTEFTVSASKAVQFKEGGRADLHNVKIVVYGKDSSRFDRIAGDDFEFDPKSGDITARGRVLIDLEANPEGIKKADQAPPTETGKPIHVESDGLIFNKDTGNGFTSGKVTFETPEAAGSAVGLDYVAKTGTMTLRSSVAMDVHQPQKFHLIAEHGVISKGPTVIVLDTVHMTRANQQLQCDRSTFFLRNDNTVERILAEGDVEGEVRASSVTHARSDRAELLLTGTRNQLTTAFLTGNVHVETFGASPAQGDAGRATLHFGANQVLEKVHAEDGVRLIQNKSAQGGEVWTKGGAAGGNAAQVPAPPASPQRGASGSAQEVEMTAPVMDFVVNNGNQLESAQTSGPPQIVITQPDTKQKTVVTARRFTGRFTAKNRLDVLHGEPDARIVSSTPGQPDRTSTSPTLDVRFAPEGSISGITQAGGVTYVSGTQKGWAQTGNYTAADQMLVLNGSPRVVDDGMTTTAQTISFNRATGDAFAEGNVKSTYSELKAQPDGAMLASSDPIHVISQSMTAHRSAAVAVYTGNARLWQNSNVVEAPTLQFDRDHRSLVAQGSPTQLVKTVLVQMDSKTGKATPVTITSAHLTYTDRERKAFFEGGVTAKGADEAGAYANMTSRQMSVFMVPQGQPQAAGSSGVGVGTQVEKIIAQDNVVLTQPARRATGDQLVYTAAEEKFVLTGGPPSIFDAERGKITGESLTFFRHDDRVLVEGRETSPAVTRTQVAR